MTTVPFVKSEFNKPESAWQRMLPYVAMLALLFSIGAWLVSAANAALPMLAEMRIQNAVNALSTDRLTPQRHQAQSEIEKAGEGAVPTLLVALRSGNPTLRQNAADMLGFIASPQSATALRNALLNDAAPAVRRNAAWSLGEIQDLTSLNALVRVTVLDRNLSVRQTAADSIARIRSRLALTAKVNEQTLSAYAISPTDSNQAFLARHRDLIASRDGGKTWTTYANALPSLITFLAVSPTNAQLLYASADGLGLFQSTNGGVTWAAINTGLGLMPGARFSVTALGFDPTDVQHLFVTTGVWLGTSQVEFFPINVMHTLDGGATWQLYQKSTNVLPITQLAMQSDGLYALAGDQVVIY